MNNRLIKSNDAGGGGGCTNTVDLYNPFPDGGGVALYQLNGDATDVSGNYDGTATNVTYGAGQFGQAGVFNGSSSSVNVPYNLGGDITISGWFKLSSVGAENPIINLDNLGAGARALQIKVPTNDNRLYVYWFTGSDMYTTTTFSSNVWYHFAATFEENVAAKIYINGQFDNQVTNVGVRPVQPNFFIGKYGIGNINYNLNGSIDQVRIFSRALRPYEVEALYTEEYCTPTIVPSEHFNTVTYTGTGTTGGNTLDVTGAGFQPDFVWVKNRSFALNHYLYDSVRGTGAAKALHSNTTSSEATASAYTDNGGVANFLADGFTAYRGTDNTYQGTNMNGQDYVSWNFKAGGAAVTNTDGTITSQVSANTEAGFSVVTFTGNGSTASVGHGLGQKPSIIFTKNRSASEGWFTQQYMYVPSGNAAYGYLNTTAAFTGFTDSLTNDTVMQQGGTNGQNYVSYCFAEVEGFSSFGSYVGTGAAGNTIVTGFEPAFVMVKCTSNVMNWATFDNKRDTTNPNEAILYPNSSIAETNSSGSGINFLANGFELDTVSGGWINTSGYSFIYMAFAADPTAVEPTLEDSFNTVTYTGNDTARTIDVGFQPDLVWIKSRNNTINSVWNHSLFDSVRTPGWYLRSDMDVREYDASSYMPGFTDSGFNLTTNGGLNDGAAGGTYVAWAWKGAEIPAINSNGSIPSVVSANPAAGFSIVSWNGNSSTATIGHGLGSAPKMIITKARNVAGTRWNTFHASLGTGKYLSLNTTDAATSFANAWPTLPDENVWYMSSWENYTGENYISYCFAEVAGFSKFGSYIGNGSTNVITTGFEPAFVIIKAYTSADNWVMIDNKRGVDNRLYADLSNAEDTLANRITFDANGFTLTTSAYNASGFGFIYMAFANQF